MPRAAAAILACLWLGAPARGALSREQAEAVARCLSARAPAEDRPRLEEGVRRAAELWDAGDGTLEEFKDFCAENFVPEAGLGALLERFEAKLEALRGHFAAMELELRREIEEDRGRLGAIDRLFAALAPAEHLEADLFRRKPAFAARLNFPPPALDEVLREGDGWPRRRWAAARLGRLFAYRVPEEVRRQAARMRAAAAAYNEGYAVRWDRVVGEDGAPLYRAPARPASLQELRGGLAVLYDDAAGLAGQRTILTIMERIVSQEIPQAAIGDNEHLWTLATDAIDGKASAREPDTRYGMLLSLRRAARLEDPHYPGHPTLMDRAFGLELEMPEDWARSRLEAVLSAPAGRRTAELIKARLRRPLQPFDIWYGGLRPAPGPSREELDALARRRYPTAAALRGDIPRLLRQLGFSADAARLVAARVEVDAARSDSRAEGPCLPSEPCRLRAQVRADGLDYEGFAAALRELGRCAANILSREATDHYLLAGLPNDAFSEVFPSRFQGLASEALGLGRPDARAEALQALDELWTAREAAGTALVELAVWRWLYGHPDAAPEAARDAVLAIARSVWNKHFAPLFEVDDSPILAFQPRLLSCSLCAPKAALGLIVAAQVAEGIEGKPLGAEMERLCRIGALAPAEWMRRAVGEPVSARPLLERADRALADLHP
ncbi:MAG: hypothetical protein PHF00_07620 [Elusimicrobia bacterium]|nr:hypothetical protein [Elusimicrobiota bacterium]